MLGLLEPTAETARTMTTLADPWTRLVSWLKFILPLLALGLLSTLFLLARTTDPERAIPYANVDVTELSRDQRVTAPTYSGVTRDGAAVRLTAESVQPRLNDPLTLGAITVSGRFDFPNGTSAEMDAPAAAIDTAGDLAHFLDGVTIRTSTGYMMETETLSTALATTDIVAESHVHAVGPVGALDAGSMRIGQDDSGGYVIVFNGGVRLVYEPPTHKE
jgi:lipopolysaccharide export system protein LptC